MGSIPGSGRSPGVGNGNPFQYFCLKDSMDRGACWATLHGSQRVGHDWETEHTDTHTHSEITESELKRTSAITYHNHLIFQLKILRSRQKIFAQGHIANPSQSQDSKPYHLDSGLVFFPLKHTNFSAARYSDTLWVALLQMCDASV